MNMHVDLTPKSADDFQRFFKNHTPEPINYTFKGTNHQVFKKTPRYVETVFWHDTHEYVGIYKTYGKWNGQRFEQKIIFRYNRGKLDQVTSRAIRYFS